MSTSNNQQIGQYVLEEQVGQGGMGTVYRAQHPTLKRTVAIKLILNHLTADDKTRERFQREAQTVAQLRHPNIVTVYDFGVDDDRAYMVLEYIGGGTLQDLIKAKGALSQDEALRIAGQIAAALDYAHQQGIVHRDLKPANIMFTDNTHHQAVLTDFGLVRVLGSTIETEHGSFVGTPAYISPEVIGGEPATPAADMYALGLILVEMLTGKPVAPAGNIGALLLWHIRGQRPDLSGLGLPPNLIDLITRSLNPTPTQRPTAADMLAVLRGNDDTRESDDDTLAGDTMLLFDQVTPVLEARLIGHMPLSFDKQRRFVGRDEQIGALHDALIQGQRMITVVGKSGIGKSALVSKVLSDTLANDSKLSGIVAMSATGNEGDTLQLSLDSLLASFQNLLPDADLGPNPQSTPQQDAQRLLDALRGGRYILLLDNLETLQADDHSVRDAGIAALLEAAIDAEGLSIVITSQVPLRLKGVGKTARVTTITLDSGLDASAGLALLHQLWTEDTQPDDADLQRLVAAVDGHPRALEAASDWLAENPNSSIDDVLTELAQQQGDVVYHLVGKSINGLPKDMQRLLAAVAIFDGSTTLPAVEAVIAPFIDGKARELLNRLVLRRFVRFDPASRTLDLHTLDRAYSRSLLPQTTEDESVYGRYALLRRAAAYFERIRKPEDELKQYDDLRPQLNEFDFRVALGEYDTAATIILSIEIHLGLWGYVRQSAMMYERLNGNVQDTSLALRIIGSLGRTYGMLARFDDCIAIITDALPLARHAQNREIEVRYLGFLGNAYYAVAAIPTAIDHYQQALAIYREIGDKQGEGRALGALGTTNRGLGHMTKAIEFLQEALAIARDVGDKQSEAHQVGSLATLYSYVGDMQAAINYSQQALAIARDVGDKRTEGRTLCALGIYLHAEGDTTTAIDHLQQGLAIAHDIGDKQAAEVGLLHLGRAVAEEHEFDAALGYLQQRLQLSREFKHKNNEADTLLRIAELHLLQADFNTAHTMLSEAIHLNSDELLQEVGVLLGLTSLRLGQTDAARQVFSDAVSAANSVLAKTENYFRARYALGLAQAGLVLLDHRAAPAGAAGDPTGSPLTDAIETYRLARENCDAAGVLRDQRRWLDMLIESDGGEVLRPVREVLG